MHSKETLQLICHYLNPIDNNSLRICSKYLSRIAGKIYFSRKFINLKSINCNNKHEFRYFVHKYNLSLNFKCELTLKELSYFNSYNINKILEIEQTNYVQYFLPKTLKILSLKGFNDPIVKSELPRSLKKILLDQDFDTLMQNNPLPVDLKDMLLHCRFNKPLTKEMFPPNLEFLLLNGWFKQPILKNTLPDSLTELWLFGDFNSKIEPNILPPMLKILNFGTKFNQSIELNVLPKTLKILKLSVCFDKELVPNTLPPTLEYLKFGSGFQQVLSKNVLPTSLRFLQFYEYYDQKIEQDILPNNLEFFQLICCDKNNLIYKNNIEKKQNILTYTTEIKFDDILKNYIHKYVLYSHNITNHPCYLLPKRSDPKCISLVEELIFYYFDPSCPYNIFNKHLLFNRHYLIYDEHMFIILSRMKDDPIITFSIHEKNLIY